MIGIIEKFMVRFTSPRKRADYLKHSNKIKIGEFCEIYEDVSFGSEPYLITIGNKVRISKGVKLTTHDGGMWVVRNKLKNEGLGKFGTIVIGNNVHIGINTIIMPNVEIGNDVIIGAGSVVTNNVPSNSVYAGVPAKKIKTLDEYMEISLLKSFDMSKLSSKEKRQYLECFFKKKDDTIC